jgi:nucleolar protein 12
MLPRELRVSRCKAPHKTNRAMERANKGKVIASGSGSRKPGKANGYVRKVTAEEQTLAGRTGKLLGRSAAHRAGGTSRPGKGGAAGRLAAKDRKGGRGAAPAGVGAAGGGAPTQGAGFKTPEAIVFEGRRASAKDGKPRDLKIGRKGGHKKEGHGKKKPKARGAAK